MVCPTLQTSQWVSQGLNAGCPAVMRAVTSLLLKHQTPDGEGIIEREEYEN